MRLISFSLTTPQFLDRTKDVTRRLNWLDLRAGERLMGCEKVMGRRNGEPLVRLGAVEVVNAWRERLERMTLCSDYGRRECIREGFPEMTPAEFVAFFCKSHGPKCKPATVITRIEFRYL